MMAAECRARVEDPGCETPDRRLSLKDERACGGNGAGGSVFDTHTHPIRIAASVYTQVT